MGKRVLDSWTIATIVTCFLSLFTFIVNDFSMFIAQWSSLISLLLLVYYRTGEQLHLYFILTLVFGIISLVKNFDLKYPSYFSKNIVISLICILLVVLVKIFYF